MRRVAAGRSWAPYITRFSPRLARALFVSRLMHFHAVGKEAQTLGAKAVTKGSAQMRSDARSGSISALLTNALTSPDPAAISSRKYVREPEGGGGGRENYNPANRPPK